MMQAFIAYAIVISATAILLFSAGRIGLAILSEKRVPVDFDVSLDYGGNTQLDDDPILPINQRKMAASKGVSGPEAVSDVLPGLFNLSSQVRKIDEKNLPFKCGVIVYDHHIPGEGGVALNEWIKELVDSNDEASIVLRGERESKESFFLKMGEQIHHLERKGWKIINSHKNGLAFAVDENILLSWRQNLEKKGCELVAAVLFSDPLDHSIKHTRNKFDECNCTMKDFKGKILEDVVKNPWPGQLDRFLFNSGDGLSIAVKDKVKSAMRLLEDTFDIVVVDDGQANLAEEILRFTGWASPGKVKKASISNGGLVYSKDLVAKYGKLSTKNGDVDFIDAVKHVYYNSLGYLMLQ